MKYIFMVGYPRSGTTLAQSVMMGDEDVFSMPESHIFTKGLRFKFLPKCLSSIWTSIYVFYWIKLNFNENYFYYSFNPQKIIKNFFKFIEIKALNVNKNIILEKTPAHLNEIETITAMFPACYFVHVIRNPNEAIPSIMKAAKQWDGDVNLMANLNRWLLNVFKSVDYCSSTNQHLLIKYEDIVLNRKVVIDNINESLGLNVKELNASELAVISQSIITGEETWKSNNLSGQRKINNEKLELATRKNLHSFSKILSEYTEI